MENETLGQRIKRLRQRHGWSQEILARHAEMSTGAISRIESGETSQPYPSTIKRLCDTLQVSRAELLGMTPDGSPYPTPKQDTITLPVIDLITGRVEGRMALSRSWGLIPHGREGEYAGTRKHA